MSVPRPSVAAVDSALERCFSRVYKPSTTAETLAAEVLHLRAALARVEALPAKWSEASYSSDHLACMRDLEAALTAQ